MATSSGPSHLFPGKRYEDWDLEDPVGKDMADVRPIRDAIERRVLTLINLPAPH